MPDSKLHLKTHVAPGPAAGYGWVKKDRIAGATISGLPPRLTGPTSAEPP
jgi:hypothetical protein